MDSFWSSFLANLLADALMAVTIYLIITQPGEKRRAVKRRLQALGLLKSEVETNLTRVRVIAESINFSHEDDLRCPLRFTRGAWNALRDSGFISERDDPRLAYSLFRMNEINMVATDNLRLLWERANLEDESKRTNSLRNTCLRNCKSLEIALVDVLQRMSGVQAITFDYKLDDGCRHDNDDDEADMPAIKCIEQNATRVA